MHSLLDTKSIQLDMKSDVLYSNLSVTVSTDSLFQILGKKFYMQAWMRMEIG